MASHEVIKVAVAHQSMIIRTGTINTLKRTINGSIVYTEIAHPEDFETRIRSFAPDILIVDPLFGEGFDIGKKRSNPSLHMSETYCIALLATIVPKEKLAEFKCQMTIFDDEQSVKETLLEAIRSKRLEQTEGEEQLSSREKQVVRGIVRGLTTKEIAQQMNLSVYTVLTHRRNISKKLQIHSSIALAMYAISNNIVTVGEVKS